MDPIRRKTNNGIQHTKRDIATNQTRITNEKNAKTDGRHYATQILHIWKQRIKTATLHKQRTIKTNATKEKEQTQENQQIQKTTRARTKNPKEQTQRDNSNKFENGNTE